MAHQHISTSAHRHISTLKTYREQGLLPYSRIGGRVYFRLSDIERYLNSHVVRERRK